MKLSISIKTRGIDTEGNLLSDQLLNMNNYDYCA